MQREKKSILLVSTHNSVFTEPCRKALLVLGYHVNYFDYRSDMYFTNRLVRKLYRLIPGAKNILKKRVTKRFLSKVDECRPDYVFSIKAELLAPSALQSLSARGIVTMNWCPDDLWEGTEDMGWSMNVKLASSYDFFFTPDPFLLRRLQEDAGLDTCYHLPFAADIDKNILDPRKQKNDTYNISMVATYAPGVYNNRVQYMEAIKDLGLNIFGPKAWLESPLRDCYRGRVDGQAMYDVYRQSKIVPNIHYDKGRGQSEGINLRPFEAMACGAMLVSDDTRADIFRLFKDGKEFVSFPSGNYEKFRSICMYYLDHPEERKHIAENGYRSIIERHTYTVRMKEMMDLVIPHKTL